MSCSSQGRKKAVSLRRVVTQGRGADANQIPKPLMNGTRWPLCFCSADPRSSFGSVSHLGSDADWEPDPKPLA